MNAPQERAGAGRRDGKANAALASGVHDENGKCRQKWQ
jgi:hypothetical protein